MKGGVVMDEREQAEAALRAVGFKHSSSWEWTRPNTAQQDWVEDDRASILPYDAAQKYLVTITVYANAEQVPALLAGGLTDEERVALTWALEETEGACNYHKRGGVIRNLLARMGVAL